MCSVQLMRHAWEVSGEGNGEVHSNKTECITFIYIYIDIYIYIHSIMGYLIYIYMYVYTVYITICSLYIMVGGIPTPLNNMSSSVGVIIPNIWKNKTCSKPPTSIYIYIQMVSYPWDYNVHKLMVCGIYQQKYRFHQQ